jgi:hypothetical protein
MKRAAVFSRRVVGVRADRETSVTRRNRSACQPTHDRAENVSSSGRFSGGAGARSRSEKRHDGVERLATEEPES